MQAHQSFQACFKTEKLLYITNKCRVPCIFLIKEISLCISAVPLVYMSQGIRGVAQLGPSAYKNAVKEHFVPSDFAASVSL